METIIFPPNAVFHTLTHFETLDERVRAELCDNGFDHMQIDSQLQKPGSKFFSSFASSPQEVVSLLREQFPEEFSHIHPDDDGRARLSFDCGKIIGSQNVVDETELLPAEKETIRVETRDGCPIRTVKTDRIIPTRRCQLIMGISNNIGYLCSLVPGELAPPLPRSATETPDPYWTTHLFIR